MEVTSRGKSRKASDSGFTGTYAPAVLEVMYGLWVHPYETRPITVHIIVSRSQSAMGGAVPKSHTLPRRIEF